MSKHQVKNIWQSNAHYLRQGFLQGSDEQTSELLLMGLEPLLNNGLCRILDIGGGDGKQSVKLAKMGHHVTLVDIDPEMVKEAHSRASQAGPQAMQNLRIIHGSIDDSSLGQYDLVCCHSVLMYERQWSSFLKKVIMKMAPGGLLSLMSVNPEARAMRLGMQRRWREVVATLALGRQCDPNTIESEVICLSDIKEVLSENNIEVLAHYGVGVFETGSCEESLAAEWLAGSKEPYRSVARCYHLVAQASGR